MMHSECPQSGKTFIQVSLKMKTITVFLATLSFLFFGISSSSGQVFSEEAKRHFDRGIAAVEMAKSPDDYAPAIEEFEQAIRLAPGWPDVYYNLGMVQERAGKYRDAITSLRQYLRRAPNASDAEAVKSLINKLEFKAEQEITKDDALDIFGSLLDRTKWRSVGKVGMLDVWVKGLRRVGDRILITYINDYGNGTTDTIPTEHQDKTSTLMFRLRTFNACHGVSCFVDVQYTFEIVSKNKVKVKEKQFWPKFGRIHNFVCEVGLFTISIQ